MGFEYIENDYFTLTLTHKLDEGKTGGFIFVILGTINDELVDALKNNDRDRLTDVKMREVEGDSIEKLMEELKSDELKLIKLVEKHFNVKLTSTAMQVRSVKFKNN